jgi:hypothetical protein
VNPNPQFLLSPLETSAAGVIDYSTKDGKKLHERATKPLFGKDDLFDVEPSRFDAFMHKLATRAKDLGWTTANRIGQVPADAAQPNANTVNIFEDYGTRTLEQVQAFERTYLATQTRAAQDSKLLFDLLMDSISTTGYSRISIWREQYA